MAEHFTLPAEAATTTLGYLGDIVSGYWELIALAIGIPLGFYVIRKLMALLPGK